MEWLTDPQAWLALLSLTALEVVLGIDNLLFLSIVSSRLPESQRQRARRIGLMLAMVLRIALLFSISWVMGLSAAWFTVFEHPVTGRDLILGAGGLFLMWKAVTEIHHKLEGTGESESAQGSLTFGAAVVQILVLDAVFSLDSIITAVGVAQHLAVMVIAIVIAIGVMLAFMERVCAFIERHPTVKMLGLSFLLLIGFTLITAALHFDIPKGYLYFAMAFSVLVEALNLRLRTRGRPVELRGPSLGESQGGSNETAPPHLD